MRLGVTVGRGEERLVQMAQQMEDRDLEEKMKKEQNNILKEDLSMLEVWGDKSRKKKRFVLYLW